MIPDRISDPALTIALALAAGMLAQAVARHLRVPGIVVLLGAGVLLGPDGAAVIRPETLGRTLPMVVGFSVAVILFEGGMNLSLSRLRREARSIRQLVTLGALVTAAGGAASARLILGWSWTISILFGTLVIVTGPTVVTPLLRRLKVEARVATLLEAEGVLTDAVGAVIAVAALEIVMRPPGESIVLGALALLARFGVGIGIGVVGGAIVVALLKIPGIVPEGLENVLTLSLAIATFQVSNSVQPESGIVAAVVAGAAVGNVPTVALKDLRDFKEQLTVLLIGVLFVLLAADVRIVEVRALGLAGVATAAVLMFVVRPLNVAVGTWGCGLSFREKTFLSWIAPRGIVAAAVASLFGETLTAAGRPGGRLLPAMVFLVIAATVLWAGLTGGFIGRVLGLRRKSNSGYAILGANGLARELAGVLKDAGNEVVLIDANPDACADAEKTGFRVLFGSGISEAVLQRAMPDTRAGCVALTANDEVNLLFARKCRKEFRTPRAWVTLRRGQVSVSAKMVADAGAKMLFGKPRSVDFWTLALERGDTASESWVRVSAEPLPLADLGPDRRESGSLFLPLALIRGGTVSLIDEDTVFQEGDVLRALILRERRDAAAERLAEVGWREMDLPARGASDFCAGDSPASRNP